MLHKALQESKYRLPETLSPHEMLKGLAKVAAIARSSELDSDVQILLRRYRSNIPFDLSLESLIIASACHFDKRAWASCLGTSLSELAFSELTVEEADLLHIYLHNLCQLEPFLWLTCGRADAAIKAFRG